MPVLPPSSPALYSSRWVWELTEGVLKNMNYPPSFTTKYFFIVKLLLIVVLLGVKQQVKASKAAGYGLAAACVGLTWTAITRTVEAYGVSGPWGLYGSPGLLLFIAGLLTAGFVLLRGKQYAFLGKALSAISLLYFMGGLSSVLLFNLLGRDYAANYTASVVANLFLIAEGACWITLGVMLWKTKMTHSADNSLKAGRSALRT